MFTAKLRRLSKSILVVALFSSLSLGIGPAQRALIPQALAAAPGAPNAGVFAPLDMVSPAVGQLVAGPYVTFLFWDPDNTFVSGSNTVFLVDSQGTFVPLYPSHAGAYLYLQANFASAGWQKEGWYTFTFENFDGESATFSFELSLPPCPTPTPPTVGGCDSIHYRSR